MHSSNLMCAPHRGKNILGAERGRMMEGLLKERTVLGAAEKLGTGLRDIRRAEGLSWGKRIFKALSASFNASFQSDWENATSGLFWKEWGKL